MDRDFTIQSDLLASPSDPSFLQDDLILIPRLAAPRSLADVAALTPVDFINHRGAALLLWIEMFAVTGGATLASLKLQARIANGTYDLGDLAAVLAALSGSPPSRAVWLFHPQSFGSAAPWDGKTQVAVPRRLRIPAPTTAGSGTLDFCVGCSFLTF